MRLSIAIVNWNTNQLLTSCLRSIAEYPPDTDYEVIVVDNASEGFAADAMRDLFPGVSFIANDRNAGYAEGNNQAFQRATGEYVLLLNPDTQVTQGALDRLVEFMDAHQGAAAAGARLVRPDGRIEASVRGFPYPVSVAWEFLGLSRLFPRSRALGAYRMTYFNYDCVCEVDQPMGSCLILRASAIEDVGNFDQDLPIFFNEVDWLYRAKRKGWKIYFTPDATLIHHGAGRHQPGRKAQDDSGVSRVPDQVLQEAFQRQDLCAGLLFHYCVHPPEGVIPMFRDFGLISFDGLGWTKIPKHHSEIATHLAKG